jgi:hypothetical protein
VFSVSTICDNSSPLRDRPQLGSDLIQGVPVSVDTFRATHPVRRYIIIDRPCSRQAYAFQMWHETLRFSAGSVPFLLREHLSYAQLGTFALSSYPYSLKLLWSPIVDSVYFKSVGRRKSWIIPMQLVVGTLMLYISSNVQTFLDQVCTHFHPACVSLIHHLSLDNI